jgi:hypothetical protein
MNRREVLHEAPPRAEAPIRVTLAIEPDPDRTREWFRRLLADARAWKAEKEKGREAA